MFTNNDFSSFYVTDYPESDENNHQHSELNMSNKICVPPTLAQKIFLRTPITLQSTLENNTLLTSPDDVHLHPKARLCLEQNEG